MLVSWITKLVSNDNIINKEDGRSITIHVFQGRKLPGEMSGKVAAGPPQGAPLGVRSSHEQRYASSRIIDTSCKTTTQFLTSPWSPCAWARGRRGGNLSRRRGGRCWIRGAQSKRGAGWKACTPFLVCMTLLAPKTATHHSKSKHLAPQLVDGAVRAICGAVRDPSRARTSKK